MLLQGFQGPTYAGDEYGGSTAILSMRDRGRVPRPQPFDALAGVKPEGLRGVAGTTPFPQAYKDVSSDSRRGLSSFFAYGKRTAERDAYQQAHMTPSGVPGVVNLGVMDPNGNPIPFAPFNWNGRQMLTDARGMIKYVEKDYFQTAISLENERVKYVTQMISLVVGQPSENVIALFGYEFYNALAGDEDAEGRQALYAQALYRSYLSTAGLPEQIAYAKMTVFRRYSFAECSPEVMCNFGDNDPEWSRAFNKLAMLIEYHPSAILFDGGSLNPLDASGTIHGDTGANNKGPSDETAKARIDAGKEQPTSTKFPDSNRAR
jgi:hypothetical protein